MLSTPDGSVSALAAPCVETLVPQADGIVDDIIAVVRQRTGIDFSQYRRATIERRIGNRMISIGASSLRAYLECLRVDSEEATRLLQRLTIKVSRFYRNARTFDALAADTLPALAQARGDAPLRIWSAGCGHGEEAYTLAMLMDTAGVAGTIDATDIDAAALVVARRGVYRPDAFDELPPVLMNAYLDPAGVDGYRVRDAARERVRFMRHDLTASPVDAASYDLICCRNVLIYFDRTAQQRAFELLRGALAPDGYLCLGEAEWPLPGVVEEFAPQAHKTQIFRRIGAGVRTAP